MSSQQMLFFLAAAGADVMGKSINIARIRESYASVGRSVEKTVVNFLEPTDRFPDALGWLEQTHDPSDKRTRNLVLTDAGVAVVGEIVDAMRYA